MKRCDWCGTDPLYMNYHDNEWGIPVRGDQKMFEFLLLETFQAGLSWITILRKRENFRKAFDDFDYHKIATYQEKKVQELLQNEGIIRNQLKVRAAITNAKLAVELEEEGIGISNYFWNWVDNEPIVNHPRTMADLPATSELSDSISKDMKKRGFKFVGSTVIYAHLQATGIIEDHLEDCSFKP